MDKCGILEPWEVPIPKPINESGLIAGSADFPRPDPAVNLHDAVIWENGKIKDLGTVDGDACSRAYGVNARGQVVGGSGTASGDLHAFVWQDGTMTDLTPLIHTFSSAISINERGQIVGLGEGYSFLWQHGTLTNLLPGRFSIPYDINDRGQIVGEAEIDPGTADRAFLLQGDMLTDLGTLGGESSVAQSINNRAQVVGVSLTSEEDVVHAFLWQNSIMIDLGTLGRAFSNAEAINERGQIAGFSENRSREFHAVLWTK